MHVWYIYLHLVDFYGNIPVPWMIWVNKSHLQYDQAAHTSQLFSLFAATQGASKNVDSTLRIMGSQN